jgi:hypothetical protein
MGPPPSQEGTENDPGRGIRPQSSGVVSDTSVARAWWTRAGHRLDFYPVQHPSQRRRRNPIPFAAGVALRGTGPFSTSGVFKPSRSSVTHPPGVPGGREPAGIRNARDRAGRSDGLRRARLADNVATLFRANRLLDRANEGCEVGIRRQGRKPIFGRPFRLSAFRRAAILRDRAASASSPDARAACAGRRTGNAGFCRRLRARRHHARRQPAATSPVVRPTEAGSARRAASALGADLARSRRPKPRRRLNADDISQAHARQRRSERRVDPVTGIRQHDALRHTLGARGLDPVKGDLRFGLEHDVLGHAGSSPANRIGWPIVGKIERRSARSQPPSLASANDSRSIAPRILQRSRAA